MSDFGQVERNWKVLQTDTLELSEEIWGFLDALFLLFLLHEDQAQKGEMFPLIALCQKIALSATQALKALDMSLLFKLNALK